MDHGLASLQRKVSSLARRFPAFSYPEVKKLLNDEVQPLVSAGTFRHFETLLFKARISRNQKLLNCLGVELMFIKHRMSAQAPFEHSEYPTVPPGSHILKTGITGSGKTKSSNIDVIRTALRYPDTLQVVIDVEGDRAPDIISKLEQNGFHDWWYFDHTTIRENMFELDRYSDLWFSWLARVFLEAAMFGDIGLKTIRDGFALTNSRELVASRGGYATYREFVEDFSKLKARKGSRREGYNEVAEERFRMFLPAIAGLFDARKSFPWEKLSGVVIYDLKAIPQDGQVFFQNYIATKFLFIRTFLTDETSPIIYDLDEMSLFWSAAARSFNKGSIEMPIIIVLARRSRKRGIFISFKDQLRKTVPEEISSQCGTQFIFRHTNQNDLRQIGEELNLSSDQLRFIARMPNRHCVFVLPGMLHPKIAEIPFLDGSNNLSHDEIREIMAGKLRLMEREVSGDSGSAKEVPDREEECEPTGREVMLDVLSTIAATQGMPLACAEGKAGLENTVFWTEVRRLEEMGLIRKEKLNLGFRGRPPWFAEVTEEGAKFMGVSYEDIRMKGKNRTLKARVMCHMVAKKLTDEGHSVALEYRGADIVVTGSDGRLLCYEVESAFNQHIPENIRRDYEDLGAAGCTVILADARSVERAEEFCRKILKPELLENTTFIALKSFLRSSGTQRKEE